MTTGSVPCPAVARPRSSTSSPCSPTSSSARCRSSPYVRCVQTVEPLADKLGLPVEDDERLAEGADPSAALDALLELADRGGVACSHGDLIPVLLDRLVADGMRVEGPLLDQKGSSWILETEAGRVVRGRYVAPRRLTGRRPRLSPRRWWPWSRRCRRCGR